jgi:glycosyltransferase involved in cell wall biosynthesis
VKIAYLVNEYPKTSHSFIRREIAALEDNGVDVERISIRRPTKLVDDADRVEAVRTWVLLDAGLTRLALSAFAELARRPTRFLAALRTAWKLGGRSERGRLRHIVYLAEACLLARRAGEAGCSHVHAHFGTNPAAVALLCRRLGGPTYSFTVHGPEEFDAPQAWSLGDKVADAAFVVAISDFTRSQLYRWCEHRHWRKIQVVHCGVDAMFLAAPPTPMNDTNRLVCVGRLCEQKGQLLLVEAAGRLRQEGRSFELVLVGDGPMRGEIERLVDRLELHEHVLLVGWKSNDEVRALIADSRATVLASFAEGLPVVLMEALALGRPVISTFVAGISELVRPGECGWLVPAGSVTALEEALREVLDAPIEQLEDLGERGAAWVRQNHDADHEARTLIRLFRGSPPSDSHHPRRQPAKTLQPR